MPGQPGPHSGTLSEEKKEEAKVIRRKISLAFLSSFGFGQF